MGDSATRVVECNKKSCEKSYLWSLRDVSTIHALETYTFLEIKEVNASGRKYGARACLVHLRIWSSELILELTITERNKQKDRAASAPVFYEE